MLFDSPAKHDRTERHLMRQRGAGARAINANFNFTFGPLPTATVPPESSTGSTLTQSSSSDHALAVEATDAYSTQIPKANTVEHLLEVRTSKITKPRVKRSHDEFAKEAAVVVQADNESIKHRQPIPKPYKRGASEKEPSSAKDPAIPGQVQPVTRSQPRRAATSATARVKEDFVEETIPVDSKRKDDELHVRVAVKKHPKKCKGKTPASYSPARITCTDRFTEDSTSNAYMLLQPRINTTSSPVAQVERENLTSRSSINAKAIPKQTRKTSRQPLADVSINNINYASSPEKLSENSKHHALKSRGMDVSQNGQTAGISPPATSTPIKRRRKRLHVIHDEESKLNVDGDTPKTELRHSVDTSDIIGIRARKQPSLESDQPCNVTSKRKPRCGAQKPSPKVEPSGNLSTAHAKTRTSTCQTRPQQLKENTTSNRGSAAPNKTGMSKEKPAELCETADTRLTAQVTKDQSKRKQHSTEVSVPLDVITGHALVTGGDELLTSLPSQGRHQGHDKAKHAKRSDARLLDTMPGRRRVPVTRQRARALLETMPKMNLDDLISNIAFLAQSVPSATGSTDSHKG